MQKERGFTLIELLVVISIIAVLMSILMPALNKAKLAVKDSMCLSNEHQFALFFKLYTDDHDGKFPPRGGGNPFEETMGGWPGLLYSYMPSMDERIWHCPAATKAIDSGGRYPYAAWSDKADDGRIIHGSYIANFWVANDPDPMFFRTPNIKGAGLIPLLIDGNWKDCEPLNTDEPFQTREEMVAVGWTPNAHEMRRVCIDRHGCHVNTGFLDLSAGKIGLKHLWRTKWHAEWDMLYNLPVWPTWLSKCSDPEW